MNKWKSSITKIWRDRKLYKKQIQSQKKISTKFTDSNYFYNNQNVRTYNEYLQTEHWLNLSRDYKVRFPMCEKCRIRKSDDVHHRNYQNLGKERYWDLIVLCRDCHFEKHGDRNRTAA